jgi:hypothetical protein
MVWAKKEKIRNTSLFGRIEAIGLGWKYMQSGVNLGVAEKFGKNSNTELEA